MWLEETLIFIRARGKPNIQREKESLLEWWSIGNQEDFFETLAWIEKGGHRKSFIRDVNSVCDLNEQEMIDLMQQYAEKDKTTELDNLMKDMLEKYPDNPDALCYKGINSIEKGQLDEAEKIFKNIINNNPKYEKSYIYLGGVYRRRNDYKKAK